MAHLCGSSQRRRAECDHHRGRAQTDETRRFVETAFRDGAIQTSGTAITKVLPASSRFTGDGGHGEKKQRVLDKLAEFFERFFGLSTHGDQA